jgi:hypothetical protein
MILIQIIIISLLVFAIHYTMLPGEIFGFVEKWWSGLEKKISSCASTFNSEAKRWGSMHAFGFREKTETETVTEAYYKKCELKAIKKLFLLDKISQPLFRCPVCMAPWYGTILYWLIPWPRLWLPAYDWVHWLIIIICTLGLNSIVVRFFKEDDE